jgi:hypothetical protein
MEIQYNIPIEVTEGQYRKIMRTLAGVVAGRKDEDGKYWVKLWFMKYRNHLEIMLKNV